MAKQTKKQQIVAKLDAEKLYSVDEALATLREHKAKFDETVEVAMNLGVDPRHPGRRRAHLLRRDRPDRAPRLARRGGRIRRGALRRVA